MSECYRRFRVIRLSMQTESGRYDDPAVAWADVELLVKTWDRAGAPPEFTVMEIRTFNPGTRRMSLDADDYVGPTGHRG